MCAPILEKRNHFEDPNRITILSLLADTEDRCLIDDLSSKYSWDVFFAKGWREAYGLTDQIKPAIILFDRDVAGADWRHVVSALASTSTAACVLLVSRVADDYLWNEVVSNGGYDVVPKPLREDDLVRVVRLAWSYWNGIRQAGAMRK